MVLDWYTQDGHWLLGETSFVAVPERGKDWGRIHVHAAIRRGYRLDYSAIIASWSAYLTARGYNSSTGTHRFHAGDEHGKATNGFSSARVCGDYMAKYLAKGFETDAASTRSDTAQSA
jgi:hypothetical protein